MGNSSAKYVGMDQPLHLPSQQKRGPQKPTTSNAKERFPHSTISTRGIQSSFFDEDLRATPKKYQNANNNNIQGATKDFNNSNSDFNANNSPKYGSHQGRTLYQTGNDSNNSALSPLRTTTGWNRQTSATAGTGTEDQCIA